MTSKDISEHTSLPESDSGTSPSNSPDGPETERCSRGARRVSHSHQQESRKGKKTSDIFGPSFYGSSPSGSLQQSLANRLRANLDANGSLEYGMTWKHWDMPSGPPICALRASARRTSGKGCSGSQPERDEANPEGYPTPIAHDGRRQCGGQGSTNGTSLSRECVEWFGWPTPDATGFEAQDVERLEQRRQECKDRTGNGNGFGLTLGQAAKVLEPTAGWPTPEQSDASGGRVSKEVGGKRPSGAKRPVTLGTLAAGTEPAVAGWATPTVGDSANAANETASRQEGSKHHAGQTLVDQTRGLGPTTTSSTAAMGKIAGSALNAAMSRWLLGGPASWDEYAPFSKEWVSVQKTLRECSGDLEAFSRWLVEIALAD